MSEQPLCSVCIANYNGEQYLSECIDSVKNQIFDHPIEIIVHDDASSDESVTLVKEKYPEINLIVSSENVGFCISNNRMVSKAHGTYILLLNNDATLFPDAIATLYQGSLTHGDGIFGLPQYNAQTGVLIDQGSVFDPFLNPIPNLDKKREDVGMIIGACMWLPRSLWNKLGGFPECFESLAEDMYLSCVARLWGYPVKCLNLSGFNHWVGRNIGGGKVLLNNKLSTTISRRAKSERNKSFVMLICYPHVFAYSIIPLHLFLLVLEGSVLAIIKKDFSIWNKIYGFCLKEIWKKRHLWKIERIMVQKKRKCSLNSFLNQFSCFPHKLRVLLTYGLPDLR